MVQKKKSLEQVRANLNRATDTAFWKPARANCCNEFQFQFQVSYDCCAKRLQMCKREKIAQREKKTKSQSKQTKNQRGKNISFDSIQISKLSSVTNEFTLMDFRLSTTTNRTTPKQIPRFYQTAALVIFSSNICYTLGFGSKNKVRICSVKTVSYHIELDLQSSFNVFSVAWIFRSTEI